MGASRGASVELRHRVLTVCAMCAHPRIPGNGSGRANCLLAIKRERDCRCALHTLPAEGTAHPFSGLSGATISRTVKRVTERRARLPACAEAEGSAIVRARPAFVTGNPGAGDRAGATDTRVAGLEAEVVKLGGRCRAREHALERLSGALLILRQANRSLSEENSLLRLELACLRGKGRPNVSPTTRFVLRQRSERRVSAEI